MTWSSRVNASRGELVYLVRGNDSGRKAWYYVFVEQRKLQRFLMKVKQGSLNLTDYGEVLYSGWGQDPPDEIVARVRREYS